MIDDEQTRAAFGAALLEAATVRGEPMPQARIRGYFNLLSDYDLPVVLTALRLAMQRGRFFPQPADLIAEIDGVPEDRAVRAWDRLVQAARQIGFYRTVDFADPVLHAAIEAEGGWHQLGVSMSADPEALSFMRRRFLERYRAYERYLPGPPPTVLLGINAVANEGRGGWTHGLDHEDLVAAVSDDGRTIREERKHELGASRRQALPAHEDQAEVTLPQDVSAVVDRLKAKMTVKADA